MYVKFPYLSPFLVTPSISPASKKSSCIATYQNIPNPIDLNFSESSISLNDNNLLQGLSQESAIEQGQYLIEQHEDEEAIWLLDDKQFAHIHADSYARDTSLEGSCFSNTVHHFLYYLSTTQIKEIQEDHQLISLFQTCLKKEQKLLHNIEKNHQEAIQRHSDLLYNDLMKLQMGESLLICGGYRGHKEGHGMLYQFTKYVDAIGKIRLRLLIFNTGDGLEYHQAAGIKGKMKYTKAVCYENICLEPSFKLKKVLEVMTECYHPLDPTQIEPPYNADYLYEKVFPSLGGILNPHFNEDEDVITSQRAGFCSERVLHAYLRHHLINNHGRQKGLAIYKSFMCEYKFRTLISYYQKNKVAFSSQETKLILMKRSIKKYYNTFGKFISNYPIDEKWRIEKLSVLVALEHEMKTFDKKDIIKTEFSPPLGTLETAKTYIGKDVVANIPSFSPFNTSKIEQASAITTPFVHLEGILEIHTKHDFISQVATLKDTLLQVIGDKGEKLVSKEKLKELLYLYDSLLNQVPVPKRNVDLSHLWNQFSIEESQAVLADLDEVSRSILIIYSLLYQDEPMTPAMMVNYYKQMAIMYKLVDLDPKTQLGKLSIGLPSQSSYPLKDPKQNQNWAETQRYLELEEHLSEISDFNRISIFELEDEEFYYDTKYFKHFIGWLPHYRKTRLERIAEAYSDLEGIYIPKSLALFRRHQARMACVGKMLDGYIFPRKPITDIHLKIDSSRSNQEAISIHLIINQKSCLSYLMQKEEKKISSMFPKLKDVDLESLLLEGKPRSPISYPSGGCSKRKTDLTNLAIKDRVGSLTFETTRELRTLWNRSKMYLTTRPHFYHIPLRTINYFKRNMNTLLDSSYQEFCEWLLFTPGCLQSGLQHDPGLADLLARFVKEGYAFGKQSGNIEIMLFFLKLSDHFSWVIQSEGIETAHKFYNRRKKLLSLLDHLSSPQEVGLISQHLVETFLNEDLLKLSKKEMAILLKSWVLQESVGDSSLEDIDLQKRKEMLWRKFQPRILGEIVTNPKFSEQICQSLVSLLGCSSQSLKWKIQGNSSHTSPSSGYVKK